MCCHEELGLLASIEKMLKKEIPLIKTEYSIELKRKKASAGKSNRRTPFKKKLDSRSGSDRNKKRDINKRNDNQKRDVGASNKPMHKSTKQSKSHKPSDRKPRHQSKNYKPRKKNHGR
ncbi:MAG: hypothetical protein HXL47_06285 [Solobacterium sp.]|nr:hypothetical protein [Solobacterium sp.]